MSLGKKLKVLIAEDELIIAVYLSQWLQKRGLEVCEICTRGAKAIEVASEQLPDILLLDFNLADDVNGIDVALAVNEIRPTPTLFLSAMKERRFKQADLLSVPFRVLPKPFSNEVVLNTIFELGLSR